MVRSLTLLLSVVLFAFGVACDDDGADKDGALEPTATSVAATERAPDVQVPQEILDAIDAYVASGAGDSEGMTRGGGEGVTTDAECLPGYLCLFSEPPTAVGEAEATIGIMRGQSDAFWDVSLVKEDGVWGVTGIEYTGCC